jgi:hypothetical protein
MPNRFPGGTEAGLATTLWESLVVLGIQEWFLVGDEPDEMVHMVAMGYDCECSKSFQSDGFVLESILYLST